MSSSASSKLMEKFQSLADFLGVQDPVETDRPVTTPAPSQKMTRKAFCREVLNTIQYRESLLRRIIMDALPPAVETLLYHYAYGKPVDKVEVKDNTERVEDMTPEMVQEKLERVQKMLHLVQVQRQHEAEEAQEEKPTTSVH